MVRHEVPFDLAAETGTRKVICEHSTIGIVVTTDGSVSDIPREGYARTEKRIVEELDALGKPYIILLNSTHPDAPETKQLAEGMARDYDHTVLPVSCVDLDAEALGSILRQVLYEFPVQELDFACRAGSRCWKTATGCKRRCTMRPCSWRQRSPA